MARSTKTGSRIKRDKEGHGEDRENTNPPTVSERTSENSVQEKFTQKRALPRPDRPGAPCGRPPPIGIMRKPGKSREYPKAADLSLLRSYASDWDSANFGELRKGEVRRIHHGRTSGSVKVHSWIITLGQQCTEVQDGRSSTLVCMSLCALRYGRTPDQPIYRHASHFYL
jgi:hypothetical protein